MLPFTGDVSYVRDGMEPVSHGFFHQNEPWVLLEAAWRTPMLPKPCRPDGRALRFSAGWEGSVGATHSPMCSLTMFSFFQNTLGTAKPNSLTLCPIGSSCHLQSRIGKPEIRKPMHPTFSVVLNYTEVQGQFPTQPAWPLPCPSGFSLTHASCLSSGTVSYSIWGTIWGIGFEKKKGKNICKCCW